MSVRLGERTSQVRFIEQGGLLPAGVEEESLKHLLSLGAIAEQAEAEPDGEAAEAKPLDKLTSAEIDAVAAERGVDLTGAKTKAEKVAALEAAAEAEKVAALEAAAEAEKGADGNDPYPSGSE